MPTADQTPDADQPVPNAGQVAVEGRLITAGAVGGVLAVGIVVGVISSAYATELVRFGPLHLSVGALMAGVFALAGGVLASWALTSRDAALLPGIGWFLGLAVLVFVPTGGGDVLVPGSGDDVYAFLTAGVGGAVLAGLVAYRDLLAKTRARAGRPGFRGDRATPAA